MLAPSRTTLSGQNLHAMPFEALQCEPLEEELESFDWNVHLGLCKARRYIRADVYSKTLQATKDLSMFNNELGRCQITFLL